MDEALENIQKKTKKIGDIKDEDGEFEEKK